jgi:glyoxylase-like metal-dependent hydrolase (beta-lactamase superfamily II)
MDKQIPLSDRARADEGAHDGVHEVAPDLGYQRLMLVNVVFVGHPGAGDRGWTLVDAGLAGTAPLIRHAAEERFGRDARPAAIVMTHGHFDHVGALARLAEEWDAPIYAHRLELPYLDGTASYPPPDPSVGGMMAALSPLFPRGPIDVRDHLYALPDDGSVPGMPGWRWIATPGHTEGHVAFWREADRMLISGDAVITTRQESAYAVATQSPEMHGPPAYFTPDWHAAHLSAQRLAALDPEVLVPGHGRAFQGEPMRRALRELGARFREVAVPKHGRYVDDPVTDVRASRARDIRA